MSNAQSTGSVLADVLNANQGRGPAALRLKLRRMAESSFAFFRGSCERFARRWADDRPPGPGPSFLICGDLHLENFGAYRDDEGEFLFDINDFDEAAVAPCAIDPVRCAASVLLAAELWGLSPLQSNGIVLAYLDEYRKAVCEGHADRPIDVETPRLARGPIWDLLGKTALGTQEQLLDRHTERLKHGTRRIIRDRKHPEVSPERRAEVAAALAEYDQRHGATGAFSLVDVTGRLVGIGSLGLERYLVLVAGGGTPRTNRLLDVKREQTSVWVDAGGRPPLPPPASEAACVVHAQRTLQARPTAGLDVLPISGVAFRLREMIPEENRANLDRFQEKPAKLRQAIVTAGRLTGLAHLRGALASGTNATVPELASWARGPALDSVLAAAARFAEDARIARRRFRAEWKDREALPKALRSTGRR